MRGLVGGASTFSSLLLALALGLAVWMAATSQELSRITFPQDSGIPIELINVPEGLTVISGQEQRVRLELTIASDQVSELDTRDIRATADLSNLDVGEHQVEVVVDRQPLAPRFKLRNRRPNRINVTLDELVRVTLPVTVEISDLDDIPQNYRVITPTVSPPRLTLVGAASRLEPVREIVAEVALGNAREPVEFSILPRLRGEGGAIDASILDRPLERVEVTVPIEQRQGFRELIVHPTLEGEPTAGYWVSRFSVEPDIVTVVGQPEVVDALESIIDTEPIVVEGLGEGEIIRNVPLKLPENVSPLEDGFVTVRITIEPQTYSRVVTVEPEITGLDPGLGVAESAIVPSKLDVLLKGPLIELDELSLDEIAVTLDLAGLEPGVHLIRPKITPPGTLRAESVLPEQIEVTIEELRESREVPLRIAVSGLASGTLAVTEPVTVTAMISGTVRELDALADEGLAARVALSQALVGSQVVTPTFTVDPPLTLLDLSPATVTLRIYRSSDVRVVSRQVEPSGLAAGLTAISETGVVIVRALGPGSATTLGQDPSFRVFLDLDGLGEGEYRITPRVVLPVGYQLIDVTPRRVRVQIE